MFKHILQTLIGWDFLGGKGRFLLFLFSTDFTHFLRHFYERRACVTICCCIVDDDMTRNNILMALLTSIIHMYFILNIV